MRLIVDISVFVADVCSWGRIWGPVELQAIPSVGITLSFAFAPKYFHKLPDGFVSELRIESVVLGANIKDETGVMIFLEDVIATSIGQADEFADYFDKAFGLHVDRYING